VRHRKADFRGRRVGVVLSGGNVDLARLSEYVSDGRR
jgi:threonine dehydratase